MWPLLPIDPIPLKKTLVTHNLNQEHEDLFETSFDWTRQPKVSLLFLSTIIVIVNIPSASVILVTHQVFNLLMFKGCKVENLLINCLEGILIG